ncbi:unnamed protein product [Gadus morhua 'NCC']
MRSGPSSLEPQVWSLRSGASGLDPQVWSLGSGALGLGPHEANLGSGASGLEPHGARGSGASGLEPHGARGSGASGLEPHGASGGSGVGPASSPPSRGTGLHGRGCSLLRLSAVCFIKYLIQTGGELVSPKAPSTRSQQNSICGGATPSPCPGGLPSNGSTWARDWPLGTRGGRLLLQERMGGMGLGGQGRGVQG